MNQSIMIFVTGSLWLGMLFQRLCSLITLLINLVLPLPDEVFLGSRRPCGCDVNSVDTASMYAVMVLDRMFLQSKVWPRLRDCA